VIAPHDLKSFARLMRFLICVEANSAILVGNPQFSLQAALFFAQCSSPGVIDCTSDERTPSRILCRSSRLSIRTCDKHSAIWPFSRDTSPVA
jgi:hypothetical protein